VELWEHKDSAWRSVSEGIGELEQPEFAAQHPDYVQRTPLEAELVYNGRSRRADEQRKLLSEAGIKAIGASSNEFGPSRIKKVS